MKCTDQAFGATLADFVVIMLCPYSFHKLQMWFSFISIAAATLQPREVLLGKSEHEGYTITLNPLRARACF